MSVSESPPSTIAESQLQPLISPSSGRERENFYEHIEPKIRNIPPECLHFRSDESIDFDETFLDALNQGKMSPADAFRFNCATNSHIHRSEIWERIPREERQILANPVGETEYSVVTFMARFLSYEGDFTLVNMDAVEVYKECMRNRWFSAAAGMFKFFSAQSSVREIELSKLWFQALASQDANKRDDLFEVVSMINAEKCFTIDDRWIETALKAFFKSPREANNKKLTVTVPKSAEIEEIDAWMREWTNQNTNQQSAEFTEITNHTKRISKFLSTL